MPARRLFFWGRPPRRDVALAYVLLRVQPCHEFTIGGSGGVRVLVVFLELEAQIDGVLFECENVVLELIDVVWGAEASAALLCVEPVGLEGRAADGGSDARGVGWFSLHGVSLFEQGVLAVEEAAVDAGAVGDAGDADLLAVGDASLRALSARWRRWAESHAVRWPWRRSGCWSRGWSCGALRGERGQGLADAGLAEHEGGAVTADGCDGSVGLGALVGGEFVEAGVDSGDEAPHAGYLLL
jgi:hypothetical protein